MAVRLINALLLSGAALVAPLLLACSPDPTAAGLAGKCLDQLSAWKGDYGVEVGVNLELIYRERLPRQLFLLTSRDPSDACNQSGTRTILSALELPAMSSDEWVAVSFDCSDPTARLTSGRPLIGIFKKNDRRLPQPAEKAWLVDTTERQFPPVESAACSSFD